MDWRDLQQFPIGEGEWQSREKNKTNIVSKAEALNLAKKWNYFTRTLVSSPESNRYLPMIAVPELHEVAHNALVSNLKRAARLSLFMAVIYFLTFSGLLISRGSNIPLVIMFCLVFVYFQYEYRLTSENPDMVVDRGFFYYWLCGKTGFNYYVMLAVTLVCGLVQGSVALLDFEENFLFLKVGVVYSYIEEGEYWRFLIGPFLHSDLFHWIMNFLSCFGFLMLLNIYSSPIQLLLAYCSLVLSGIAAFLVHHYWGGGGDAFAGVSGVIFYALGFATSNIIRNPKFYPRGFLVNILFISVFSLILPFTFVNQTSNAGHVAGFLFGILVGGFFKLESSHSPLR